MLSAWAKNTRENSLKIPTRCCCPQPDRFEYAHHRLKLPCPCSMLMSSSYKVLIDSSREDESNRDHIDLHEAAIFRSPRYIGKLRAHSRRNPLRETGHRMRSVPMIEHRGRVKSLSLNPPSTFLVPCVSEAEHTASGILFTENRWFRRTPNFRTVHRGRKQIFVDSHV